MVKKKTEVPDLSVRVQLVHQQIVVSQLGLLLRQLGRSFLDPFLIGQEGTLLLWSSIHNTSFSSQLMNGLNKLECYIAIGWKGLQRSNTLAYWANL